MSKRSPKVDAQSTTPEIRIKREYWKTGAHSVARDSLGHWVTTRKWHTKKDTEEVKTYVVYIQAQPEKKYRKPIPKRVYSYDFERTKIRPEKYVYLMRCKFEKEWRTFSMTSSELHRMDEQTKMILYGKTIHAYGDSPLEGLKLFRIYNSHTMETIRRY